MKLDCFGNQIMGYFVDGGFYHLDCVSEAPSPASDVRLLTTRSYLNTLNPICCVCSKLLKEEK